MPIAVTCDCGRAMRVKDEVAGKKIRCPACSAVLTVSKPEALKDAEAEALQMLMEESDEPTPPDHHVTDAPSPATDSISRPPKPEPPPSREPPPPEWKWKKKDVVAPPKPVRKSRGSSGGGLFNNVNPNYGVMWTGVLMIGGSLALGLVNLVIFLIGYIWPYLIAATVILFFAGLGTIFKGLMGRSE
jgi:hypothetical protein